MRNSERKISPPPYVVGYGSLRRGALRVVFMSRLPLWSALAERSGDSAFGVRREAKPRFTRRSATPLWDAPEARGWTSRIDLESPPRRSAPAKAASALRRVKRGFALPPHSKWLTSSPRLFARRISAGTARRLENGNRKVVLRG